MSQRSQIEWLKFSRLRNKPLITCTDQCEYYCFHIFCSFLSFDSHGPSSGPYEIIVIFYFLSGNPMLVITWRSLAAGDQERRLAQSSGTSLRGVALHLNRRHAGLRDVNSPSVPSFAWSGCVRENADPDWDFGS